MQAKPIPINYVEFNVSDIEQSKTFYGNAFGWEFTDYGPEYCEFRDGVLSGGFTTLGDVRPDGPMIVLYSEQLQELMEKISAAGGTITKDIFQFPGGERFEFTDPDGYQLAVWRKT